MSSPKKINVPWRTAPDPLPRPWKGKQLFAMEYNFDPSSSPINYVKSGRDSAGTVGDNKSTQSFSPHGLQNNRGLLASSGKARGERISRSLSPSYSQSFQMRLDKKKQAQPHTTSVLSTLPQNPHAELCQNNQKADSHPHAAAYELEIFQTAEQEGKNSPCSGNAVTTSLPWRKAPSPLPRPWKGKLLYSIEPCPSPTSHSPINYMKNLSFVQSSHTFLKSAVEPSPPPLRKSRSESSIPWRSPPHPLPRPFRGKQLFDKEYDKFDHLSSPILTAYLPPKKDSKEQQNASFISSIAADNSQLPEEKCASGEEKTNILWRRPPDIVPRLIKSRRKTLPAELSQ